MSNLPPDQQMRALAAAREGDAEAFGRLVVHYEALVQAVVYGVVRDHVIAADLTQDSFVQAWQKLPQLRQLDRFRPWLLRIAKTTALAHRKLLKNQPAAALERPVPDLDPSLDPLGQVTRREDNRALHQALARLPQRYRQPLFLFYFMGKSQREIAATLTLTESNVAQRLSRGRALLREKLSTSRLPVSAPTRSHTSLVPAILAALPTVPRAPSSTTLTVMSGSKFLLPVTALLCLPTGFAISRLTQSPEEAAKSQLSQVTTSLIGQTHPSTTSTPLLEQWQTLLTRFGDTAEGRGQLFHHLRLQFENSENPHSLVFLQTLLSTWVEHDPLEALEFMDQLTRNEGRAPYFDIALARWLAQDYPAALTFLKQEQEKTKSSFARLQPHEGAGKLIVLAIARESLTDLASISSASLVPSHVYKAVAEATERRPHETLSQLAAFTNEDVFKNAALAFAKEWLKQDPQGLIQVSGIIEGKDPVPGGTPEQQRLMMEQLQQAFAGSHPAGFLNVDQSIREFRQKQTGEYPPPSDLAIKAALQLSRTDLTASLTWLTDSNNVEGFHRLLSDFQEEESNNPFAGPASTELDFSKFLQYDLRKPEVAAQLAHRPHDYLQLVPDSLREVLLPSLLNSVPPSGYQDAWAWMHQQPDATELAKQFVFGQSPDNPAAVLDLLLDLPPAQNQELLNEVFHSLGEEHWEQSRPLLDSLLKDRPSEHQTALRASLLQSTKTVPLQDWSDFERSLSSLPAERQVSAVVPLAHTLSLHDPAASLAWAQNQPAGPIQDAAIRETFATWGSLLPDAAAATLPSLPAHQQSVARKAIVTDSPNR